MGIKMSLLVAQFVTSKKKGISFICHMYFVPAVIHHGSDVSSNHAYLPVSCVMSIKV